MKAWVEFRRLPWWWQTAVWVLLWPLPLGFWVASVPRNRRLGPALLAASSLAVWVAVVATGGATTSNRRDVVAGGAVPTTTTGTLAPASASPGSTMTTGQSVTTTTANSSSSTTSTTGPAAEPSSTSTSTTVPPTGGAGPAATIATPTTTTTVPTNGEGDDPTAILTGLRIAPEGPRTGYSRELFRHWVDGDGDRCDTREEVLIVESTTAAQVDPFGCKVLAGDWVSLYDGVSTDDPSTFDIDHVVALAEAWDSGASGWTPERRHAFANDLDHPQALRAVTASSNRSKSDLDPAQWKPSREAAWCEYARDWVTVKKAWDLSADRDEVDDLRVMLRTCR